MKPKLKDFIPYFGIISYYRRYFKLEKTDEEDVRQATIMKYYHTIIIFIISLLILILIK